MGYKSGTSGQHISCFFTIISIISVCNFWGCAKVQNQIDVLKNQQLVARYRDGLSSGFYETVIHQSKKILEVSATESPADVALYALGETYVHYDFAGKDYELSKYYFKRLIENFPDSPLTPEAKTFVSLFECFDVKDREIASLEQENESISVAHEIIQNQNFTEAINKNLLILEQAGDNPPRDGALYNLGLIYAHIDNPAKDFKKSQRYFSDLIKDFPDGPLAGEAQVWLGFFKIFDKMQQIDLEIEQQKKQLSR